MQKHCSREHNLTTRSSISNQKIQIFLPVWFFIF